ncbi:VWA domain-containing protein [Pontixanthobacter sp.]|uniref:VWA domain-containing protein n=1 Tax=Pontixanthobacter sp. TaxID=2792078 RepID=UPI003C7C42DA
MAARLFISDPLRFGGIVLRGYGVVRDQILARMVAVIAADRPVQKIPINADHEQLFGGLDLTQTLASGTAIRRAGLIKQAAGGVVIVPMAERIEPGLAAGLAQAMDNADVAIILLDDGLADDDAPPEILLERSAFHCNLAQARSLDFDIPTHGYAEKPVPALSHAQRAAIAAAAYATGIHSARPIIFAERCACTLAALQRAEAADDDDLQAAMRLVLSPRARYVPESGEQTGEPAPDPHANEPSQQAENDRANDKDNTDGERGEGDVPLDELLIAAAQAAIPPHILDQIKRNAVRSSGGPSGKSGQQEKSARRGRPRGSEPGLPRGGRKLALIDTLRAAAPWQTLRRREISGISAVPQDPGHSLHIRKSDIRIRRFIQNRESLTIFAVDASGSSALARLAEAKGAIELMLAEAHVKRSQVALIAFRHHGADILLPATRSLTRARRALTALPGGGGTPLAAGLIEARLMADSAHKRGQTPTIAVLTDGKANVTLAGMANRVTAMNEAEHAAKGIAAARHNAIVIDIAPRPREEAQSLAAALHGRYVPLPRASSAAMVAAIESIGADTVAL